MGSQDSQPLAQIPQATSLSDNPFLPPRDGRCLINQLPPELLAHIFLLGTVEYADQDDEDEEEEEEDEGDSDSEDENDEDDEEDEEPAFEMLVSHVCPLWREVALDTPSLWTRINFSEGMPYEKSRMYLERSKGVPVDISVDVTRDEGDEEEADIPPASDELEAILKLILPHAFHWRLLDLAVSNYDLMHSALVGMGNCPAAPMLEVLELYHYEEAEEAEEFTPPKFKNQDFVLFHGNAPNLQFVALWGVHLNWAESRFLSGLLDLELAYHAPDVRPTFKEFARILRDSPELATLSLCQTGPVGGPVDWLASITDLSPDDVRQDVLSSTPSPITTLSVPSLKGLVLAFLEPEYATALMERLVLPNLVSLAVDFEEVDCSAFLQTLVRPSHVTGKSLLAGLEALKISGLPCDDTCIIADAYAAMVNLRSLNLNFGYISEAWHSLLAKEPLAAGGSHQQQQQQVTFLPRLESLTTAGLDGPRVREVAETRKAMGLPLKSLYINEEDDVEEDDERWFEENVDDFQRFEGSDEEEIELAIGEDGEDLAWEDII